MPVELKDFEVEVLHRLTDGVLMPDVLEAAIGHGEFISYEFTGCGYYFTFGHSGLPADPTICHRPLLLGEANGVEVGFLVLLGAHKLSLECHEWGVRPVPEDFRDHTVAIRVLPPSCELP